MISSKLLILVALIVILAPSFPFGIYKVTTSAQEKAASDLSTVVSDSSPLDLRSGPASSPVPNGIPNGIEPSKTSMPDAASSGPSSTSSMPLENALPSAHSSSDASVDSNPSAIIAASNLTLHNATPLANGSTSSIQPSVNVPNSPQNLQAPINLADSQTSSLPDHPSTHPPFVNNYESVPLSPIPLSESPMKNSIPVTVSAVDPVRVLLQDYPSVTMNLQDVVADITSTVLRDYFGFLPSTGPSASKSSMPPLNVQNYAPRFARAYLVDPSSSSTLVRLPHYFDAIVRKSYLKNGYAPGHPSVQAPGYTYSLELVTGSGPDRSPIDATSAAQDYPANVYYHDYQASPHLVADSVSTHLPTHVLAPTHLYLPNDLHQRQQASYPPKMFYKNQDFITDSASVQVPTNVPIYLREYPPQRTSVQLLDPTRKQFLVHPPQISTQLPVSANHYPVRHLYRN